MRLTLTIIALVLGLALNPGHAGQAKWGPTPEEELTRKGISTDSASLSSIAGAASLDAGTRSLSILALARKGDQGSAALLQSLLTDPNTDVRMAAAQGLGHLRATSAIPALHAVARNDADLEARQIAVGAIGTIGGTKAVHALVELASNASTADELRVTALGFVAGWSHSNKAAHEQLLIIVGDEDPTIRTLAAIALSKSKNENAVPVLVETALNSATEEWLRDYSIRSLEDMVGELRTGYVGEFGAAAKGEERRVALTNLSNWWDENKASYGVDAEAATEGK